MKFDEVTLRRCGIKDAPALALVGAATFLESFAGVLDGAAIVAHCAKHHAIESYGKYLVQPRCRAWLAETREGAAPVGYVMLTQPDLPLPDLSPDDVELKRIYLFSRFHGNGAGQAMLDEAVMAARAIGAPRLLLGVYRGNLRGLAFYRKNGFVEVGTRTFSVGHQTYNDLVLAKPLSA